MVVGLLSKASGIKDTRRTTVQVLSKGIILELISSFKNIRLIIFCGFIDPQNFFNNKNFLDYGSFQFQAPTQYFFYSTKKFYSKEVELRHGYKSGL